MNSHTEVELRFLVPQAARIAIAAELARGSATLDRTSLVAIHFDTDDRRLARAGMAWRLRREGRRWIQTLKAAGSNTLERFEHEVIRPSASPDASEHAGTLPGDRLIALLRRASADGVEPSVHLRTEVRRTTRRIRTRGAVVDVAFDEGKLLSAASSQRVREIEFELVSGSPVAMLGLAERWRKRFGLVYDPRSEAERGDRLADGMPFPPVRKAERPSYTGDATASDAFGLVLDECLAQITRNAIGLIDGDSTSRIEHVHQLRVGIRRLRSALRSFQGWAATPPTDLVEDIRAFFAALGMSRDSDVLGSGVAAELARVGAPSLPLPPGPAGPDPTDAAASADTQRMLLAWIAWRASLAHAPVDTAAASVAVPHPGGRPAADHAGPAEREPSEATPAPTGGLREDRESTDVDSPRTFHRNAGRRLRRWHARIVSDWKSFDDLDDTGLHSLRKRIKRQRYAVEFFSPLLRRRQVQRYLDALGAVQDRMGALNDLFVARTRYQALATPDPAAWFALGWLAARIAELRALAKPELGRLANTEPPTP